MSDIVPPLTEEDRKLGAAMFALGMEFETRALHELLDLAELADLARILHGNEPPTWQGAIEAAPYLSDSRRARYRWAVFMWNGAVTPRPEDARRLDPTNRARFIRAIRVWVGLTPEPP